MFLEIHKIHGKTSVPESIFDKLQAWGNFIKKETLAQLFSCEFCQISKNNFSYRTPTVAGFAQETNRRARHYIKEKTLI